MNGHRASSDDQKGSTFAGNVKLFIRGHPKHLERQTIPIVSQLAIMAFTYRSWQRPRRSSTWSCLDQTSRALRRWGSVFLPLMQELLRCPIRHRWKATAAGFTTGLATGLPITAVLHDHLSDQWSGFIGFAVGSLVAVAFFALTTRLPAKAIKVGTGL